MRYVGHPQRHAGGPNPGPGNPGKNYSPSHRNRQTATPPKTTALPNKTKIGNTASPTPNPRQVIASKPSIAHRAGTAFVTPCIHCGNRKLGTHAPLNITINNVASVANPRAASGVFPIAAINIPYAAVISEKAAHTPTNPNKLPEIRTSNTTNANPKTTAKINIPTTIALTARLPNSTPFDKGAARNRRHNPRCRNSNIPIPTSIPMNNMN